MKSTLLHYRILLIDDEIEDYELAKRTLAKIQTCHYEIEWVDGEEQAIERVIHKRESYDAILVDYHLGAGNGIDLIRRFRAALIPAPLILFTSSEDRSIDIEAMKAGAADYLVKGKVDADLLDRSIRYSIEQKKNARLISNQQRELSSVLKMAALGEIASTITHEINNPLSVIQGRVAAVMSLLEVPSTNHANDLRPHMQVISDMISRISDIKDGLRHQYGSYRESTIETADASALLLESAQLCAEKITQASAEFYWERKHETVPLYCQPTEVSQVIVNLIANSCDAISSLSERWIRLKSEVEGDHFVITVTDSGSGLCEEVKHKIFSKFFTTKKKGMGIGLNLSRKIIESYGGTITLDEKCIYTRFVIRLPLSARPYRSQKRNILIIDDEMDILDIVKEEVSNRGHEAWIETCPLRARELMKRQKFDAVISDINMPEMDGIEFMKSTDLDEGLSMVFVFMSGVFHEQTVRSLKRESPTYFFEKPFNVRELVDRALKAVEEYQVAIPAPKVA